VSSTVWAAGPTGTIQGTVKVEKVSPDAKAVAGASGTVIYVVGFQTPPPAGVVKIIQKDKTFEPTVMPIVKGQRVAFSNADKVRHNVFSVSQAKAFDVGITPPGDAPKTLFDHTGKVDVFCNIHPEMSMTVLVLPNSAFAMAGADGSYSIPGVPPGEYTVYAWHRLGAPAKQRIKVTAGATTRADWTLRLDQTVQSHLDKHGRPYKKREHYDE
jgi:plastocyanin